MNTTDRGMRLKSEPRAIKREPGPFIKSEFGPSLASLPMAPSKKEGGENKDLVWLASTVSMPVVVIRYPQLTLVSPAQILSNIPQHRASRRRGPRGTHLVHRVDGYCIRAHYGNGKVDFIVSKDGHKNRDLDWKAVEREMFRKFHAARFFIEPMERPYMAIQMLCLGAAGRTLRFSVRARRVEPRAAPVASSENANPSAGFSKPVGGGVKGEKEPFDFSFSKLFSHAEEEKTKAAHDSVAAKTNQPNLVYPAARLPANLPEITSYSIVNGGEAKFARSF
jgi:hypothetical protein